MNQVFLSGVIAGKPTNLSQDAFTAHLSVPVAISHHTAAGVVKKEIFHVHAWRNVAVQLQKMAQAGARISVAGYLTQHMTPHGIQTAITAAEFHISDHVNENKLESSKEEMNE